MDEAMEQLYGYSSEQAVRGGELYELPRLIPGYQESAVNYVTANLMSHGYTKWGRVDTRAVRDLLHQVEWLVAEDDDWFCSGTIELPGGRGLQVFLARNETGKFTLILPGGELDSAAPNAIKVQPHPDFSSLKPIMIRERSKRISFGETDKMKCKTKCIKRARSANVSLALLELEKVFAQPGGFSERVIKEERIALQRGYKKKGEWQNERIFLSPNEFLSLQHALDDFNSRVDGSGVVPIQPPEQETIAESVNKEAESSP